MSRVDQEAVTTFAEVLSTAGVIYHQQGRQVMTDKRPVIHFQGMKFVCPKMRWVYDKETRKSKRVCHCGDPCTGSSCGRMFYIYPEKDLRAYPGTLRGTDEWASTYKIRATVEKSISHFKDSFCVAGRKTRNEKTLHADLLLAGITHLITVIVADKIHEHRYIRSLKPLIA